MHMSRDLKDNCFILNISHVYYRIRKSFSQVLIVCCLQKTLQVLGWSTVLICEIYNDLPSRAHAHVKITLNSDAKVDMNKNKVLLKF